LDSDLVFLVVDNGPEFAPARKIVEEYGRLNEWPVYYIEDPRRGIPIVRNRILDFALELGADYLVGHDDDEVPEPNWAVNMVSELKKSGAAIAGGPVTCAAVPGIELSWTQRWVLAAFQEDWNETFERKRGALAASVPVSNIYTGNFGLDVQQVRATGVRFDDKRRFSGGEDTDFSERLLQCGVTASWAQDARVTEYQPECRLTPLYIIRRNADFSVVWARYGREGRLRYLWHAVDELFDLVRHLPWIIFGGRKWKMYFLQRLGRFWGHSRSSLGIRSDHYAPNRDHFR
jgi:GT2 family glycosyltransferase